MNGQAERRSDGKKEKERKWEGLRGRKGNVGEIKGTYGDEVFFHRSRAGGVEPACRVEDRGGGAEAGGAAVDGPGVDA